MTEQEDKAKFWDQLRSKHRAEMVAVIDFLGPKVAAVMLRPDRFSEDPEGGQRWLADCYNPNKRDKLDGFDEIVLLRAAMLKGYHRGKHFHDQATGYHPSQPIPVSVERANALEEVRQLQRETNERLERIAGLDAIQREVNP